MNIVMLNEVKHHVAIQSGLRLSLIASRPSDPSPGAQDDRGQS